MDFYRRQLPHLYAINQPVFLTWRLHGSLPAERNISAVSVTSEKSFAVLDRLLDKASTGPFYLRKPEIADAIVAAFNYTAENLHHYTLHAYVIMPNHVHLLITPLIPLPQLAKSLKGYTARQANRILSMTGTPFWQQETYDRLVRDQHAFQKIRRYIEQNPVQAGLARTPESYKYSSAYGR